MYQSQQEIDEVVRGFQTLALPFGGWTHAAHLTVGMWYVSRYDQDIALNLVRHAIQHFNMANGVVQTPKRGYHETITAAYVRVLAAFRAAHADLAEPALTNAMLQSKVAVPTYLLTHYSRDRLMSWEARTRWVEPDLEPLPSE